MSTSGGLGVVGVGVDLIAVDRDRALAIGARQEAAQRRVGGDPRPALRIGQRRGPHARGIGPHQRALAAGAEDPGRRRRDVERDRLARGARELDEQRAVRRARRPAQHGAAILGELGRAVGAGQIDQRVGRVVERHPRPRAGQIGEQDAAIGVAAQRAHHGAGGEPGELGLAAPGRVDPVQRRAAREDRAAGRLVVGVRRAAAAGDREHRARGELGRPRGPHHRTSRAARSALSSEVTNRPLPVISISVTGPNRGEVDLERAHAIDRGRGLLELGLGQRLAVDETPRRGTRAARSSRRHRAGSGRAARRSGCPSAGRPGPSRACPARRRRVRGSNRSAGNTSTTLPSSSWPRAVAPWAPAWARPWARRPWRHPRRSPTVAGFDRVGRSVVLGCAGAPGIIEKPIDRAELGLHDQRLALVPRAVGLEHVDDHQVAAALERGARQPGEDLRLVELLEPLLVGHDLGLELLLRQRGLPALAVDIDLRVERPRQEADRAKISHVAGDQHGVAPSCRARTAGPAGAAAPRRSRSAPPWRAADRS